MQVGPLKRRDFIAAVGSAAASPLAARAQSPRKLRTIGFLVSGAPSSHGPWFAALAERLRQLGWIEDRDIKIEYRWAEGRPELHPPLETQQRLGTCTKLLGAFSFFDNLLDDFVHILVSSERIDSRLAAQL